MNIVLTSLSIYLILGIITYTIAYRLYISKMGEPPELYRNIFVVVIVIVTWPILLLVSFMRRR